MTEKNINYKTMENQNQNQIFASNSNELFAKMKEQEKKGCMITKIYNQPKKNIFSFFFIKKEKKEN